MASNPNGLAQVAAQPHAVDSKAAIGLAAVITPRR
jgi:hypothetical protein